MSNAPESVSLLLQQLKTGDQQASSEIWRRFIERLLPLARRKLQGIRSAAVDEEDILLSVFDRFFTAAKEERFVQLQNREDLWQVLLVLTERRVADEFRRSHAQKRGGGRVRGLDDVPAEAGLRQDNLMELVDQRPTPEFAASFADQLAAAFERLEETSTRDVALLRMEGHETKEISGLLNISLSSVERKLRMIRGLWSELLDGQNSG